MSVKDYLKKIMNFIKAHKIISLIILIALIFGGNSIRNKLTSEDEAISYITESAKIGTIISTVSGTGQVSNVSQIDLKPGASGEVRTVSVSSGDKIKAGTILVRLDTTDVAKAIRDAEASLESAEISLEKLMQPADDYTILQSENTVEKAKEAKAQAEEDLNIAYENGYTDVSNAFLQIPNVMSGLDDLLYGSTLNGYQANIDAYADIAFKYDESAMTLKADLEDQYNNARQAYEKVFGDYSASSRYSDNETVETLVSDTLAAVKTISEAIKKSKNLIDFTEDVLVYRNLATPVTTAGHQSTLNGYTSSINSLISSLSRAEGDIKDGKEDILKADREIEEKEAALARLKEDPNELDIKSHELTIRQRQNSLRDARERYADYIVTAPFDGVVAEINVGVGETIGSGTSVAILITTQKVAEIVLNEIDVAKVKKEQKVTLTFDAIENFSITGSVIEIDTLGTTSQGVVSYGIKIGFDTQDERVLSDMSVSASIITNIAQGVLIVPNAAIKSIDNQSYIEVMSAKAGLDAVPSQVIVKTGAFNDTHIEVLEGLSDGDLVVTRTVGNGSDAKSSTQPSSTNIMRMMGGGMRK